jgi:hypothetical protein
LGEGVAKAGAGDRLYEIFGSSSGAVVLWVIGTIAGGWWRLYFYFFWRGLDVVWFVVTVD